MNIIANYVPSSQKQFKTEEEMSVRKMCMKNEKYFANIARKKITSTTTKNF